MWFSSWVWSYEKQLPSKIDLSIVVAFRLVQENGAKYSRMAQVKFVENSLK